MAKRGRPFGTKKLPTVSYHRRIKPEFIAIFDKILKELKANYNDKKLETELLIGNKEIIIKVFTNKND